MRHTHLILWRVVQLQEILALQGRIPAERINDLITNLRAFWVVRDLNGINVGLTAKGKGGYSWGVPQVISVDESWDRSRLWYRAFALTGNGPGPSSLLSYSTLQEIDRQLRSSTLPFNGLEGFCGKLGLPFLRSNLGSLFQVSAELPARVVDVYQHGPDWTLDISIDFFGEPDLMVDWLPRPGLERVPAGWSQGRVNDRGRVSLTVPNKAEAADLILCFGNHEADVARVKMRSVNFVDGDIEIRVVPGDWGPDDISLEVVHKAPTVPDFATRRAPDQEDRRSKRAGKRRKTDVEIVERRNLVRENPNLETLEMCELFDKHGVP